MATPRLSPTLAANIAKRIGSGETNRHIAKALGLGLGTVSKYRTGDAKPAVDPVTAERERVKVSAERREFVESVKERALSEHLADLFAKIVPRLPAPTPHKPAAKLARKAVHVRTPILHLSDWHFAEIVKADGVLGTNSYDAETTRRRVYRVVHAFLAAVRDWRASGRFAYPELVVALNGDFLTGTIHGLEHQTDAVNICEGTAACGWLIAQAIRDLSAEFERVRVVGTVGNHGRLPDDKKVPTKQPTRSWDWLAYALARVATKDLPGVEWNLPRSYGVVYDVAGQKVYQGHGHFIKQQLNTPAYGMRRFVAGLQSSRAKSAEGCVDLVLFGHWHASASMEFAGSRTLVNPSLIGTQEYSFHTYGSVSVPAQDCYIVDQELGFVGMEPFYAEAPGFVGTYEAMK